MLRPYANENAWQKQESGLWGRRCRILHSAFRKSEECILWNEIFNKHSKNSSLSRRPSMGAGSGAWVATVADFVTRHESGNWKKSERIESECGTADCAASLFSLREWMGSVGSEILFGPRLRGGEGLPSHPLSDVSRAGRSRLNTEGKKSTPSLGHFKLW